MIRALTVTIFIILIHSSCFSITIKDIKAYDYETNSRIIIDVDSMPNFSVYRGNDFFRLKLHNAIYPSPTTELESGLFRNVRIKKEYNSTDVLVSYKYLTSSQITQSKNQNKLIVTFTKISRVPLTKTITPEIISISNKSLKDMFKLSLDLTGPVSYEIKNNGQTMMIELFNTNSVIKSRKIDTRDSLVKKVGIDQVGSSSVVSVAFAYPSFFKVYILDAPYKLIIEVDKKARNTLAQKEIVPGLTYIKLVKGGERGAAFANILIADLTSVEVFPSLPNKEEEAPRNIVQNLFSVFSSEQKSAIPYYKARVSTMMKEANAVAGVNGTYFSEKGEPLGLLMISKELISYSIHDRTSLIIDNNNNCFIDNASLSGSVSIEGNTLKITGINEKRKTGDVIIYTPRYGKQTDDEVAGLNLAVENEEVKYISRGKTRIPQNGYVISADPSYYEELKHSVNEGSKVKLNMVLSTFSEFNMSDIKHVIGGGPRLIKRGQIYISKNMEKFKTDIATSKTARTAVGITKDGKLLLVTVDKNSTKYYPKFASPSSGFTLEELAALMQELGAVEAMNLDGGGSTTFALEGNVVNNPANGEEIEVSNALLVKAKQPVLLK